MRLFAAVLFALLVATQPALAGKKPKKGAAAPAATAPAKVDPSASIALPCPFTAGATHRWKQTTTRDGGQGLHMESTLDLTTVEADDDSFLFTLASKAGPAKSDDPMFARMAELSNGVDLPYQVRYHREESRAELVNIAELTAVMADLALKMSAEFTDKGLPEAAIQAMSSMLTDPEMVNAMGTKGLLPLVQFSCNTLGVGSFTYETMLPSPLGGPALPANGSIVLTPSDTVITVTNTEKISSEAMKSLMSTMLDRLAGELPPEARAQIAALPVDVTMTLDAELDATTGTLNRATISKVTAVAGMNQREVTEIVLER